MMCNPDDPDECIEVSCDADLVCCLTEDEGDCADCSATTDPSNINPADCVAAYR